VAPKRRLNRKHPDLSEDRQLPFDPLPLGRERVKESTYEMAFLSTDLLPMGTGLLKILKLVITTGGT
jgi:hypothetical protein